MKRPMFFILILTLISGLLINLSGCVKNNSAADTFQDYRQIPGITSEEINAIEALKAEREAFIYGHMLETEAFVLPDGTCKGFTINLCALLTDLFGISFEPRLYNEWTALLEGVNDQTIDFSGDFTITPERMRQYTMTYPIAGRTLKLYTLTDAKPIATESDINGKNIGFWPNSVVLEIIREQYPALDFNVIAITGFADAVAKLQSGEADAFVMEDVTDASVAEYDCLKSRTFFPLAYTSVAIATADPALAPIVSVINKYMNAGGIHVLYDLYKEGQFEYAKYRIELSLTDEERLYIASQAHKGVSVAYEAENYPVCFYNQNENAFQGAAVEVLDEIGRLTGLNFVSAVQPDTRWTEILSKLSSGEIAMTAELLYSDERKNDYIWTHVPYMTSYYTLISRTDYPYTAAHHLVWAKVGTIRKTAQEEAFLQWFPHLNVNSFDTMTEAFEALDAGVIDLLMMSENALLTQIHYLENPGYKINIGFNKPQESYFGFNKNETVLRGIIDKAQNYVNVDSIAESWLTKVYDYEKKLSDIRVLYMTLISAVLFLILLLVSYLLLINRRLSSDLKEAVHRADAASKAKSIFLANMSHELRTPMYNIVGFTNLALDCNLTGEVRDYLDNLRINSDLLLQTIDDVLDISKIESGCIELESIPFMLSDIVQICRIVAAPQAAEKGISLYCYAETTCGRRLVGDPTRLRQVLMNLLANAVKFTHKGMVKLAVVVVDKTDDRITLRFEVKDSGIGMTAEQMEHIFEPFVQADGSIMRQYGGTGLGLPITKNFVEMMGGTLTVDSTPGLGSRFNFTLTFKTLDKPSESTETGPLSFVAERPVFSGEALVCEDNAMNQQVIFKYLRHAGLDVVIADNGQEGADIVRRRMEAGIKPFSMIFMDMHMPVMDGLDAARAITALGCRVPIVALTANILINDWEIYRENGIVAYLSKPFRPQALWDCLYKYLTPVAYQPYSEVDLPVDNRQREYLIHAFAKDYQASVSDIQTQLEKLDELLAEYNTDSMDIVESMGDAFRNIPGAEGFMAQLEAYDFTQARETLRNMIERM